MKPKTMILMIVAVACGLGASYMTSRLLAERGEAQPEQKKVAILVAKKNIETGATLKNPQELFQEKWVAEEEQPKDAISKFEELKGKVLKLRLREGDHVTTGDLMSDKESLMSYLIPKGHRAIGLRVTNEAIAGGFASLPLSRVDIISTVRRGDDKSSYSQVLLQNVLVLAADTVSTRESGKNAMPATVVTVALSPEDIVKVNLAKEYGPLTLALRGFNENQKTETEKVTFDQLLNNGSGKNGDVEEKADNPVPVVRHPVGDKVNLKPSEIKTVTWVTTVTNGSDQMQVEYTLDEKTKEVISSRFLQREGTPPSRVEAVPPPPAANNNPAVPPKAPDNKQGAMP